MDQYEEQQWLKDIEMAKSYYDTQVFEVGKAIKIEELLLRNYIKTIKSYTTKYDLIKESLEKAIVELKEEFKNGERSFWFIFDLIKKISLIINQLPLMKLCLLDMKNMNLILKLNTVIKVDFHSVQLRMNHIMKHYFLAIV